MKGTWMKIERKTNENEMKIQRKTGRKMNEQVNAQWKKNKRNLNDFQRGTKGKLMEHERNKHENLKKIH